MPSRVVVKISLSERIEKEIEILNKQLEDAIKKGKKSEIDRIKQEIEILHDRLNNI